MRSMGGIQGRCVLQGNGKLGGREREGGGEEERLEGKGSEPLREGTSTCTPYPSNGVF